MKCIFVINIFLKNALLKMKLKIDCSFHFNPPSLIVVNSGKEGVSNPHTHTHTHHKTFSGSIGYYYSCIKDYYIIEPLKFYLFS
jgi:hypothetical protein